MERGTREFTCISCPKSCIVTVTEAEGGLTVSGNGCRQGERYALDEYTAPKRILTTTVAVRGARLTRLPVIGSGPVPRERLGECLRYLYGMELAAPVAMGDVVCADLLGTGVDILAARDLV